MCGVEDPIFLRGSVVSGCAHAGLCVLGVFCGLVGAGEDDTVEVEEELPESRCVGVVLLSRVEVGGQSLEDGAFGVYVFVEGGAWYVYEGVLVVFVECVGVVFVPPAEVRLYECGG